jgi:hypothetical protein
MEGIQGDMLYGREGQFKTKERELHSYWRKGMVQEINEFLAKSDKCQQTKNQAQNKKYTHPSTPML